MESEIVNWSNKEVLDLLHKEKISSIVIDVCNAQDIDGQCLLSFVDRDFYEFPFDQLKLGERKRFILLVKKLQKHNRAAMLDLGLCDELSSTNINFLGTNLSHLSYNLHNKIPSDLSFSRKTECMPSFTPDVKASRLSPEVWKTAISLGGSVFIYIQIRLIIF